MKRLLDLIKTSLNGNSNDVSTARLQSYLIVLPILLMIIAFLFIEIWSFGHSIKTGKEYHLSNEIIIIFGMNLSHHLAILFSRNKSQSVKELNNDNSTEENPIDDSKPL